MKNLTLILGCLLLSVIPSQAAGKKQQLSNPNQRFEEIERYIARLRQGIETYYANQIIEVQQRGESEIGQLEVADKPVYANLAPVYASLAVQAEMAEDVLHINNYGYQVPWRFEDKHVPRELGDKAERMSRLRGENESYKIVKSAEWFAAAQSLIARKKSYILGKMAFETANLERQKNYALTVTLPELEKRLKEDLLEPKPKPTHGLVTGIVYSANKPCAVVDREIVYEGDVIRGVKVVKIYQDSVKFSRKSRNWEQKVQQAPEAYW